MGKLAAVMVGAISVALATNVALACGTERWAVKTGTDRDAAKVATSPETTGIANLTGLQAPLHPNSRSKSRFGPTELKTFQVTGVLKVIKREKDEDYHLVIVDPQDSEETMIVESPAPTCVTGSKFEQQIDEVRSAIEKKFGKIQGRKTPNVTVTVTGVAFFDPIHGQEGVAANGIELHPLLGIEFQ